MRRERLVAWMRARVPPAVLPKIVAAWRAARRRRGEALLAAALVGGVVVMILHWS